MTLKEIYDFLKEHYPQHLTQREISRKLEIPLREVRVFTQAMNYHYHTCKSNISTLQIFMSDADVVEIFKKYNSL